jgi:hypothetical protein
LVEWWLPTINIGSNMYLEVCVHLIITELHYYLHKIQCIHRRSLQSTVSLSSRIVCEYVVPVAKLIQNALNALNHFRRVVEWLLRIGGKYLVSQGAPEVWLVLQSLYCLRLTAKYYFELNCVYMRRILLY